MSYTPSPWKISEGNSITAHWENGEEVQVALMATTQWAGGGRQVNQNNARMRSETQANVCLIVAAPEGYELALLTEKFLASLPKPTRRGERENRQALHDALEQYLAKSEGR